MKEKINHPLITVVVPVYCVEAYLERCVKSLVSQTYRTLEILLIDDGSPDNSPAICDEWEKRDVRIRVFHKENGGLSDARNFGILHAKGEYITFVDSDDYVADEYIEYLYELIQKENADTACCNFRIVTSSTEKFEQDDECIKVYSGKMSCMELYNRNYVQMVVSCGKLYKTWIVKENMYPVGRLHEDEATTYKLLYNSNRVVISNYALYAYFQNENSITHTRSKKNEYDIGVAYQERASYFKERKEWNLYAKTVEFYTGVVAVRKDMDSFYEIKKLFALYRLDIHIFLRTKIKMIYFIMLNCWKYKGEN